MIGRGQGASLGRTSGPVADPNSLRSAKRGAEWTRIPRNAREGKEAPIWPPYVSEPTDSELSLWLELWRKPQAILWIRDEVHAQVAMYCRLYISSMRVDGFATEKTAAERMAGSLLLTVPALMAAKVMIVDPESAETDVSTAGGALAAVSPISSVRNRTVIVNPSANDATEDENESVTSDD